MNSGEESPGSAGRGVLEDGIPARGGKCHRKHTAPAAGWSKGEKAR
jgi:hypothetical protein